MILVTVDTFEFSNRSESAKASPVRRMATLTPAICATVDTFSLSKVVRELKSVDRYDDGDPDTRDPCDSDTFESPKRSESPKTSTVTRMVAPPTAIPVTVDILEFRTSSESRKTLTITGMATVTPAIPVTVDRLRI